MTVYTVAFAIFFGSTILCQADRIEYVYYSDDKCQDVNNNKTTRRVPLSECFDAGGSKGAMRSNRQGYPDVCIPPGASATVL